MCDGIRWRDARSNAEVRLRYPPFQIGEARPGAHVAWKECEIFLVQGPAPVDLAQLELQVDVACAQSEAHRWSGIDG